MNKNESKYFNTAEKMDKAFLSLLEKKDFAFITVKEICEKAQVNRSTFYLHYETLGDLLAESVEYMNERFYAYMKGDRAEFLRRLGHCSLDELYLITPQYLIPYLNYVKDNKRLVLTAIKNTKILQLEKIYDKLFSEVFTPILERYGVSSQIREYMMSFYINGLMAIVTQWICNGCEETPEHIADIMRQCTKPH